ncbi:MAG: TrkA family potassium uptake protein [Spiribacter sp.]|jgi:trk system potassium uptake protein TrkA|nr:TrkA family potassium uptake protein [Spiribacter sp.]MDR9489031.1 TrkA family potassium uptake protein [Spiribacter sp.]
MDLVIVGAGSIGISLVERALAGGHDVVMVEPDAELAEQCASQHDVRVLAMNVGDERFAEESRLDHAEALIATTGDDSTNIMTMLLGQEAAVNTLTSTVNQAVHIDLFRRLGVRVLADPERLVAQHLLDITLLPEASDVTTLRGGQQVIELKIGQDSPLIGLSIEQIQQRELLDHSLQVIARVRGDKTTLVGPNEQLAADDGLIVFATERLRGRRRQIVYTPAKED